MQQTYISLKDFCNQISISTSTAYRMIREGTLPAVKIGRNWKIPTCIFTKYQQKYVELKK